MFSFKSFKAKQTDNKPAQLADKFRKNVARVYLALIKHFEQLMILNRIGFLHLSSLFFMNEYIQ